METNSLPQMRRMLFPPEHIAAAKARAAARTETEPEAAAVPAKDTAVTPTKPVEYATNVQRSTNQHTTENRTVTQVEAVSSRTTLQKIRDEPVAAWTYKRKKPKPVEYKSQF